MYRRSIEEQQLEAVVPEQSIRQLRGRRTLETKAHKAKDF